MAHRTEKLIGAGEGVAGWTGYNKGLANSSPERGVCGEMMGETGMEGEERAEEKSR